MEISLIVAGVLVAAAIFWFLRSERRESHHLDNLHISGEKSEE